MVDFRKLMLDRMSEKDRADYLLWEGVYKENIEKYKNMDLESFLMFFLYYWSNSYFYREWLHGHNGKKDITYDGVMIRIMIPELFARLMKANDPSWARPVQGLEHVDFWAGKDVRNWIEDYKHEQKHD